MSSARPVEWLRAGAVGRPHGLDGSFLVTHPSPSLPEAGGEVRLGDGHARRITRRAGHRGRVIVRLQGIEDRDAVVAIRGVELLVARPELPELQDDEWWAEDLEGCRVRDGDQEVGVVRRLLALPSCEVLEVSREGRSELLVPLVSDAVRSVDVEARAIQIDLTFLGETGEDALQEGDRPD